jgi:hypothetical protein
MGQNNGISPIMSVLLELAGRFLPLHCHLKIWGEWLLRVELRQSMLDTDKTNFGIYQLKP